MEHRDKYNIHIFVDNKFHSKRFMEHLPRLNDILRINPEKYVKVVEVVWCLDEDRRDGQRINIGTETD
jgi:hypothetical protein